MRSKKQMRAILEAEWVGEDEELRTVAGGKDNVGHLGATIGGHFAVPHQPLGPVPELDVDVGLLATPSRVVREGAFNGDEWIHDPALRGWVFAASPDQLAVRFADHLAAAGPEGWYVFTNRRFAVVVDSSVVSRTKAEPDQDAAAERKRGGVGGLLGKARSALDAVAEVSTGFTKSGTRCAMLWEVSHDQVRNREWVRRGRGTMPELFDRVDFVDGSALEIRLNLRML
ncbi:hypothetical protein GCM10011581_49240 [Saccharopolyspora subtropica]|uniref:Uncharacterized protein n=1 Tax=Saccharopolyspora thermophila TaxID=89367 RepID=A0A917NJS4_9PSEU|nr:hypothetical protein [Saccharopolyspora subtropica]GGJ06453.1 hypothetical protein GCM10011581_49240 [Saccharopolyspora subtropica]